MFDDPSKKLTYFEYAAGVLVCCWPIMRQAVAEEWADVDTADKRDWMAGALVDYICSAKDVDAWDIEELILQILQDEFNVGSVEDDSPYILAQDLHRVWQAALEDNFDPIRDIHERLGKPMIEKQEREENRAAKPSASSVPELVEGEQSMHEDATEPAQEESKAPVVDDDGFTVVQRKRR
ncbi:rRNA processing protein Tsr2 [Schizosaccharomyces cryophilus OY26]|uniref:rRNA processing protein Tsr2 n=1 Tax=Schizosaccharomyces cryophilus (strain OY26 / ATCC MYA-4695 / CBS 11777 / NBRC 106824 / NRRL Y48691) TaxID=653667 RepID=S9X6I2_SCHCR|nr:rRNA processing protein Tsr2 [Schizosaccharomyces cryophilus OY26]EPY49361.1 rRNA processing protein Tsr2 [Schizosaccharomyces cryophilus OY26]